MEVKKYTFKEKLKAVGPGMVVVGSFIGPGTITSSTRAGASFGYSLLWTIVFSVIAVIVMQGMSARLGIVTGNGLSENIVTYFDKKPGLQKFMVFIIAAAIGLGGMAYMSGDLTGTAIGISTLTGVPVRVIAPIWGLCVLFISNRDNALKWLEKLLTVLTAIMAIIFIITVFVTKPSLSAVLNGLIPKVPDGAMMTAVALIGTTVVPYNLFLHATSARQTWDDPRDIELANFDVKFSMTIGGLITASVLITAATVIRGMDVQNALDMAKQLEPLLGNLATPFMATGLIAAGISSAVVTPLGVSYVLAGLFGWDMSRSDSRFAWTNRIIIIIGIIVAALGLNPITLIMSAQALNGVFLPVTVFVIILLASKESVMGQYKNTTLQNILGIGVFIVSLIIGISSIASLF